MLRSFRVENHKSIRDEQELSLLPAYDKSKPVVPVAAIFGGNASGKSNLLDSLRWMQGAVLHSYARWEADSGVPRVPFRLDIDASLKPSAFVVDLILDGVQHVYGFTTDDNRILEEWLYSYPRRHKRVIFERSGSSVEFGSTIPERRTRSELLSSFMRDNSLLLSAAVQAKQEEVTPVYRWFREGLRFIADERRHGRRLMSGMAEWMFRAGDRFPGFVELLRVADLGISDLRLVETLEEPSALALDRADRIETEIGMLESSLDSAPDELRSALAARLESLRSELSYTRSARRRRELLFLHGEDGVALSPTEESDGTLAWINLLMPPSRPSPPARRYLPTKLTLVCTHVSPPA